MYLDKCVITELLDKPGLVRVDGACPKCGEPWKLTLVKQNIERFAKGEKAHNVFPMLWDQDIAHLINGLCNECFDKTTDPF